MDAAISGVHFQQANVDGGDAEEEGGLELVEYGSGFLMLEAFQQAHAASARQPAVDAIAERVHMKER